MGWATLAVADRYHEALAQVGPPEGHVPSMTKPADGRPGRPERADSAGLALSHQRFPGMTVIAVDGEVDITTHEQLRAYMAAQRRHPHEHLIIDLSQVTFMDSCGLRVLLLAAMDSRRDGGAVHLAAVHPTPARLLEVTGAEAHLSVHATVETAIKAILATFSDGCDPGWGDRRAGRAGGRRPG
ncbi:anti-anti-sigma factor [Nonomuraea solani]|uniref:Anti-sigma factor antagonist n=1 Tax=Nonomuraea solani TaxID=1144553 RepID=A0A1H6F218_9ACTN|nr:anti-anti-sigma factor [Nonomuraea solani]